MYTYAFCLETEICLPSGVAGELAIVTEGDLSAVVEPGFSARSLEEDEQALLQAIVTHDCILRSLFAQATILPLRFATEFISEASLRQHLQDQYQDYVAKLTYLADKAEYLLRLTPIDCPETTIDPTLKGRDYFLAKKQLAETQARWQQQQQQALDTLVGAIAMRGMQAVMGNGNQVHLLADRQNTLSQDLDKWQAAYPFWQFQLSEELPPYHFV